MTESLLDPKTVSVVSPAERTEPAVKFSRTTESDVSELFRGGMFLSARYGLGVVLSVGNMFVMTRWIGPHSYGVFITAIGLVTFFCNVIARRSRYIPDTP
ncbi:MAG: hypothetical protein DMG89_21515 [Acidobacteria bacterium]|nr:MAG: hypothetical protein DMG89_21515 [Acidobacteriota bacterium]